MGGTAADIRGPPEADVLSPSAARRRHAKFEQTIRLPRPRHGANRGGLRDAHRSTLSDLNSFDVAPMIDARQDRG
jgi:hypothetical protein